MGLFDIIGGKNPERGESGHFGDYDLQEVVNSGGMADIWLAIDPDKHPVAVRRLHAGLRKDSKAKKRFVSGCEILEKVCKHPYIVDYLGHGKIKGDLYLTMEYCEFPNLKILISRADPVLEQDVGNILIDVAEALEHVHDCGYLHYDFKPENILVVSARQYGQRPARRFAQAIGARHIVGRFIPAGTGSMTKSYTEVAKERDLAKLAERRKNQENIENLEQ